MRARPLSLAILSALLLALLAPGAALGASTIAGTVTAPVAVGEVEVCLVEPLPSESCTYPGADGHYSLTVPSTGVYQVEFLPSYRSHLVTQYYNHKAKLSEANKVAVPANATVGGVDADLELGGEIEGRATDALTTLGVEEVEVCAQDAVTGVAVSCAHTDAGGEYALPSVPPGSYRVGFWGERQSDAYAPQYYDGKPSFFEATVIPVAAGATVTGIDAALRVGARVSGSVSDSATGSPLGGIAVCVLNGAAASPADCAYTGPGGEYTLPGLPSGIYTLAFSPEFNEFASGEFVLPEEDGWHTQYFAGSATRAGASTLTLTAPQHRAGVDAALLSTAVPPSPAPTGPAPDVAVPLPPVLAQPPAVKRPKKCRKGYQRRKIKGQVRCVKEHRRRHRR